MSNKFKYWHLTKELAITEFKLKYQGSVIGYFWSLMKPLLLFGVLYLVFTVFVKIGSAEPFYPLYLLLGIVLFNYFSESTSSGMRAIVDKADLIKKVYFPRIILLLSSSISALITLFLNLLVVAIFIPIAGIELHMSMLLFILVILELFLLSLGISLFLGALYVKFRDFAYIWEVLLQLLFYASAIIFPLSIVPEKYINLILLSPVTQIVQDARKVLINTDIVSSLDKLGTLAVIPYLIPVLLVISGYFYFKKTAASFAENV